MLVRFSFISIFAFLLFACEQKTPTLFENIPSDKSGIEFRNDLAFDSQFNIYTYRNFYNGGGVAAGDINNDGLVDLYFTSNQNTNKLYLNKGNFQFEDITTTAGVGGTRAWSTGVSMADVNGDGFLDIYVCNSGDIKNDNKQNELFINNGDLTFTERAEEYGLDDRGYSTHAAFFDYDKDGDLDVYLLNNSYQAIGSFNLMQNIRHERDSVGGDKLFRNDGNRFTDVSVEAGIYGSVIGFGLGVTVGDVNNDTWQDIFVSNDFFERDYLYINNQDGTFHEVLPEQMASISAASMGADMADINNDGWLDIFVTDMLPEDDTRLKQVTTFENWDKLQYNVKNGYHYQFNRNMLHLNNGNGTFSEIGRLCGVDATDWSWGALMFDMDNDGRKDIFVANGIYQDITDLDYLSFIVDENTVKRIISKKGVDYKALIDPIPVNPIPNYAFQNLGDLKFTNKANEWGLGEPIHSNGSVYADLDNDGALDLIVNNVNQYASVYRNRSRELLPENHFLRFVLLGNELNRQAVGARIEVKAGAERYVIEQMPTRGFQSSVDPVISLGLGKHTIADEIKIIWPNQMITILNNQPTNQTITIRQEDAESKWQSIEEKSTAITEKVDSKNVVEGFYAENEFVDFDRDRLLFSMFSTQGPCLAKADVNNDGLHDFYMGGSRGYPGELFIQSNKGSFEKKKVAIFESDKNSEDIRASFFDADNDGDQDLFVLSGGYEFSFAAPELENRLYLNNGKGDFVRANQPALGASKDIHGALAIADFNKDGAFDIFIGGRIKPFNYGIASSGFLFQNMGDGNFIDVTKQVAPELSEIGMITDAAWVDIDKDSDLDLILAGDWMTLEIFENKEGNFKRTSDQWGTVSYTGWWNRILPVDIDQDGDLDIVAGNHGKNSRFRATEESPVVMYVNDFDNNGSIEHVYGKQVNGEVIPYVLRHDLVAQLPGLKKKYLKYKDYNNQKLTDIFSSEQLQSSKVLEVRYLSSGVFINDKGKLRFQEFPIEAQFSPVYSILSSDLNGDGYHDLILGGNFYESRPQTGRYDASYGLILISDGKGNFKPINARGSGLSIKGAVRDMILVEGNPTHLLIGVNKDSLKVYTLNTVK